MVHIITGWKANATSVIKIIYIIENLKRRIGIAEKSHETGRNCWGGNVNNILILTLMPKHFSFIMLYIS